MAWSWEAKCTLVYCISFVGLAVGPASVIGPTLESLAHRYSGGELESEDMAPSLSGRGAGYLVGTLVFGCLSDRFTQPHHPHRLLAVAATGTAITAFIVPYYGDVDGGTANIGLLWTALFIQACFGGALDIGGNIYLTRVWSKEKLNAPMNLLHGIWGLGAVLGPLIATGVGLAPADMPRTYAVLGAIGLVLGLAPLLVSPGPPPHAPDDAPPPPGETKAAKAGAAAVRDANEDGKSAAAGAAAAAPDDDDDNTEAGGSGKKSAGFLRGIACLFLFYFAYAGLEQAFGAWVASFATKSALKTTAEVGALVTSCYWGGLTGGRLLAALLALRLSPARLIFGGLCGALLASALLLAAGASHVGVLYAVALLLGVSIAPFYPSALSLAGTRLRLTGAWTSRFIAGSPLGSILFPSLTGLLLKNSPTALGWAELAFATACTIAFCGVATLPVLEPDAAAVGKGDEESDMEVGAGEGGGGEVEAEAVGVDDGQQQVAQI